MHPMLCSFVSVPRGPIQHPQVSFGCQAMGQTLLCCPLFLHPPLLCLRVVSSSAVQACVHPACLTHELSPCLKEERGWELCWNVCQWPFPVGWMTAFVISCWTVSVCGGGGREVGSVPHMWPHNLTNLLFHLTFSLSLSLSLSLSDLHLAALLGKTLLDKNGQLEDKLRQLQEFAEETVVTNQV